MPRYVLLIVDDPKREWATPGAAGETVGVNAAGMLRAGKNTVHFDTARVSLTGTGRRVVLAWSEIWNPGRLSSAMLPVW